MCIHIYMYIHILLYYYSIVYHDILLWLPSCETCSTPTRQHSDAARREAGRRTRLRMKERNEKTKEREHEHVFG